MAVKRVGVTGAYRKHRGGEETPCKKLQEDDHHSMVNTGLTDSLRLDRKTEEAETQRHFILADMQQNNNSMHQSKT